jgi:hypothetical protein
MIPFAVPKDTNIMPFTEKRQQNFQYLPISHINREPIPVTP